MSAPPKDPPKWTFEQIEGPSGDRKKLELQGWSAPFGRPRKDAVIKELVKSRVQVTRYPGVSAKQTRHAFGTNWEPQDIRGRWMTKAITQLNQNANGMADDWTRFVQDQRTCRIAWGFLVSYIGYIEELELGRESEDEIAWRMKLQIDTRDDLAFSVRDVSRRPQPIQNNLTFIFNQWIKSGEKQKELEENLQGDFLDSLNDIAGLLNEPAAELAKLAGRFDDIEKGTFSTIEHFRGAVTGFRNAWVTMHDAIVDIPLDTILLVRSAERDLEWISYQADFDNQTTLILDQLNVMDRRAELSQRDDPTKFIEAKDGDTWESLSTRATGAPDKAGSIRSLNGARYGEEPTAGQTYLVQ